MQKFLFSLLLFLLFSAVSARAAADLKIVATTPDLASIAKQLGEAHVKVSALALETQDPHWVDARPHLALELAKADLLLIVGLDLEIGWLPTLQTGSRNGAVQNGGKGFVDCSQFIKPLEVPKGKVDRSMGDLHPHGSPHYMLDPRRAEKVVSGVAERMAALDSANAALYRKNAKTLNAKLEKWRKHWEKQLAKLKGKKLVAYHRSYAYLADWLGFSVVIHVEPRPGVPPNPGHVTQVIDTIRAAKSPLILQQTWAPSTTSKLIADKSTAKLVILPGGPKFRASESYIGFINGLVRKLDAALK